MIPRNKIVTIAIKTNIATKIDEVKPSLFPLITENKTVARTTPILGKIIPKS